MNSPVRLAEVAQIIPGAAAGVYEHVSGRDGDTCLLKGGNMDSEGGISTNVMDWVKLIPGRASERYLLQPGDVVIMARGSAIRAAFVTLELAHKRILASANFVIIRPNAEQVQGEVIVAYLNSVVGNQKLQGLSKGATIKLVATSDLRDFEIPVPAKSIQKKIADLFYANRESYQATLALAEQQRRTANAAILNMMLEVA